MAVSVHTNVLTPHEPVVAVKQQCGLFASPGIRACAGTLDRGDTGDAAIVEDRRGLHPRTEEGVKARRESARDRRRVATCRLDEGWEPEGRGSHGCGSAGRSAKKLSPRHRARPEMVVTHGWLAAQSRPDAITHFPFPSWKAAVPGNQPGSPIGLYATMTPRSCDVKTDWVV